MFRKLTAIFLAMLMILPVAGVSASADEAAEKNYIIDDPYARVDWDEWQAYKTQLHCHTTASDGFLTVKEFVQEHYDLNFDIVALTDHGTLNLGWNVAPEVVPIMRAIKKERTKNAPVIPLTDEEVRRMGIEKVYIDLDIEPGDNVKVINGPFESFMGVVEEVNMDRQVLRVKISMFGRDTPVELEFGQVDKI